MTPVLSYLLKANMALIALYGFYFLCFRRDTFYGHIRWYLLATIASVMIFPLVNLSTWLTGSPVAMEVSQHIPDVEAVYQYVFTQPHVSQIPPITYTAVEPAVARTIPVGFILLWCWLPVAVFMTGKRLFQLACIVGLWRRYPQIRYGSAAMTVVNRNIQPFSFFGHIFLNPSLYSKDELDEVVAHEQVHCRQRHTIDILLAEALACLCWFNPAVWLLRRDLKQNLEYYTDRMTLRSGFDRKHYQYSLLRVSGGIFQIVNHFHINHLKKRIIMINRKNSPRILAVKYLLVVPVLTAVLLAMQMSGLQAAEEYLNNSVSTFDGDTEDVLTEWLKNPFADNAHTPDTITSRKGNNSWVAYKGSAVIKNDESVSTFTADSFVFRGNPFPKELVLIDGKEGVIKDVSPQSIKKIEILKNEAATRQYGSRGENGVVLITTKRNESSLKNDSNVDVPNPFIRQLESGNVIPFKADSLMIVGLKDSSKMGPNPLFVLDGKIISREELEKMTAAKFASTIGSVTVFKGKNATDIYGEKAAEGAIAITTKTEKTIPDYRKRQGTVYAPEGNNAPVMKDTVKTSDPLRQVRKNGSVIVDEQGKNISEFQIRGNSFGVGVQSTALVLIDGVEGDINAIAPANIESFSVLKDASAVAVFGERGKNGVVLITTKTGKDTVKTIRVSGTVTGAKDGKPMPGVAIIVKGSATIGVSTDMQGRYLLDVPANATLKFSFAGMPTREIAVDNRQVIDVVMEAEFRIGGIGTLGANSNVLVLIDGVEGDINAIAPADIESMSVLKGASAVAVYGERGKNGVVLITAKTGKNTVTSGQVSGTIKSVRDDFFGTSGKTPLYLLDGKEVNGIPNIPDDSIHSVSVLKDASATAVYGERGKNGVVLITTKTGKNTVTSGQFSGTIKSVRDDFFGTSGNDPLIIIDGKEAEADDLKSLTTDRIESFSILKDASVTAVYGEKGKNGVIIITTKK